jgi:hypothetical protein
MGATAGTIQALIQAVSISYSDEVWMKFLILFSKQLVTEGDGDSLA